MGSGRIWARDIGIKVVFKAMRLNVITRKVNVCIAEEQGLSPGGGAGKESVEETGKSNQEVENKARKVHSSGRQMKKVCQGD